MPWIVLHSLSMEAVMSAEPPAEAPLPVDVLPLAMVVGLTALEFLIAFLQAYVFTILTCLYLNDALHPGH